MVSRGQFELSYSVFNEFCGGYFVFFALCCVVSLVGTGGLLSYPICQNEVPPKIGRVKHYFQHICCLSGCAPFFFRIILGCGSECVGPFPACLSFAFSVGLHFVHRL